jgi:hypothetical protein
MIKRVPDEILSFGGGKADYVVLLQDEGHYTSLIAELESHGARVVCIYSGGLDFSGPIESFFYNKQVRSRSVVLAFE